MQRFILNPHFFHTETPSQQAERDEIIVFKIVLYILYLFIYVILLVTHSVEDLAGCAISRFRLNRHIKTQLGLVSGLFPHKFIRVNFDLMYVIRL